jgi:hypothetical protein
LNAKATSNASKPEAVVFAAKIQGIHLGQGTGFADPVTGSPPHGEVAAGMATAFSDGRLTVFPRTCAGTGLKLPPKAPFRVHKVPSPISGIKEFLVTQLPIASF